MSLVMNERHAELADFYLSQARQYNSQHNYLRAFPPTTSCWLSWRSRRLRRRSM